MALRDSCLLLACGCSSSVSCSISVGVSPIRGKMVLDRGLTRCSPCAMIYAENQNGRAGEASRKYWRENGKLSQIQRSSRVAFTYRDATGNLRRGVRKDNPQRGQKAKWRAISLANRSRAAHKRGDEKCPKDDEGLREKRPDGPCSGPT